jgi:hypothetical protein
MAETSAVAAGGTATKGGCGSSLKDHQDTCCYDHYDLGPSALRKNDVASIAIVTLATATDPGWLVARDGTPSHGVLPSLQLIDASGVSDNRVYTV